MLEALEYAFFQRALVGGLLASVACGIVGTYVVVKEVAAISGGLAHAAFGGLGLGYFAGFDPMLGAAGFGVASGVGIGAADRKLQQGMETLVMMTWAVGMAVGIVFVTAVPGYAPDLTSYLFGNILMVSPTYLWLAAALDVLLVGAVVTWFPVVRGVVFDEEFSEVVGVPVDAVVLTLLALTSLVIVLLIRVVGVLLAVALVTIPAATARHWSRSLGRMMVLASAACAAAVTGGLFLSWGLSGAVGLDLPTGPLVVLLSAAGFGLSAWARRLAGPRPTPAGKAGAAAALAVLGLLVAAPASAAQQEDGDRPRARDVGIEIGTIPTGELNALTDVDGVRVGHATLREGDSIRTGVTAVLPHGGNLFREPVPAAIAVGNGFGKLVGLSQVNELGEIETPILLTGTLSVFRAADALVDTMLALPANRDVRSINPVVGETNDGWLSDVRARPIGPEQVREALRSAGGGPVREGSVGAGTGTRALGWKGGVGTSSRRVSAERGGWTVGVLVQTNFGGDLRVDGVPVGRELGRDGYRGAAGEGDGSVMIVLATDAPLAHRELERLASRAFLGVARAGSTMDHGSGDYAVAFSTRRHPSRDGADDAPVRDGRVLSSLFRAGVEATEEAVLNSLLRATTVTGRGGRTAEALPVEDVLEVLRRHGRKVVQGR